MAKKVLMALLMLPSMVAGANAPVVQGHPTTVVSTPVENTPVTAVDATATTQAPDQALVTASDDSSSVSNTANLANQLSMLQQQVQDLRGQLEVQQHIISQLQTAMVQVTNGKYQVIDPLTAAATPAAAAVSNSNPPTNVAQANTTANPATNTAAAATTSIQAATVANNSAAPAAPTGGTLQDEFELYQSAYNLIINKQYVQAASTLQTYIQKYPNGQYAANSHYWLGELSLMNGNITQAQAQFNTVVSQFASSPKAADAMLKLGMIYTEQMQWPQAKAQFNAVIKQFPGTNSAQLAQQQLTQIKQAGN